MSRPLLCLCDTQPILVTRLEVGDGVVNSGRRGRSISFCFLRGRVITVVWGLCSDPGVRTWNDYPQSAGIFALIAIWLLALTWTWGDWLLRRMGSRAHAVPLEWVCLAVRLDWFCWGSYGSHCCCTACLQVGHGYCSWFSPQSSGDHFLRGSKESGTKPWHGLPQEATMPCRSKAFCWCCLALSCCSMWQGRSRREIGCDGISYT